MALLVLARGDRSVPASGAAPSVGSANISPMARPRAMAMAIAPHPRNRRLLLVEQGFDPARGQRFARLPGGGIHFGELAADALARELREELGVEVRVGRRLDVLENRYEFDGMSGHQLVVVHEVVLPPDPRFDTDEVARVDGRHAMGWFDLRDDPRPLMPEGSRALVPWSERAPS